ncbi:MAG: hypothetical protein Q7S73_02240 [bacterium]|nr:hypothetical protein [bacterium]
MTKEEYRPREHNLRPRMLLEIKKDVTLLLFYTGQDMPTQIKLKKGIRVTLQSVELNLCATIRGLAIGPSVRIDTKQSVDIEDRFLNKVVTAPAQHLRVHPQEL